MPTVEVCDLGRTFRSRRRSGDATVALADVSLRIERGEIHGLLGPNGAGKTTLVKILSTVLRPTSGSAAVLGHDVVRDERVVRQLIGVVLGGERGLYTRLTARQNLVFWGVLYRLGTRLTKRRTAELLERVGLADRADDPVETFSRGMKQRLHLARGLIHDPEVLFLDEPTSGMDPVAAYEFRRLVVDLQSEGRTILLTTHDMDEAGTLCGRVTLIDHGRVLLSTETTDLGKTLSARECVDFVADPDDKILDAVRVLAYVADVEAREDERHGWRAYLNDMADTPRLLRWFLDNDVLSARRSEPSLEEIYLRTVGTRGMSV
jgi:ABC-2 type transport system ATP-binding protein